MQTGDYLVCISPDDPQFEELRSTWFGDNPRRHETVVIESVLKCGDRAVLVVKPAP